LITGPSGGAPGNGGGVIPAPELIEQAARFVASRKRVGASHVQRHVRVGFATAALLIEQLEAAGMVGKPNPAGWRTVLVDPGCACHEWHDTEAIGEWLHEFGVCSRFPVRRLAAGGIWDAGHFEPQWGRELLTALIRGTGGVVHTRALMATTLLDGAVSLDNGVHRWSIASELGIKRLPVEMRHESVQEDPAAAWVLS
jgi:hypothetical protein